MARLIHPWTGAAAADDVQLRMKETPAADRLEGAVLLEDCIVFRHGLKRFALPWNDIRWAYRQVEDSHVTLGCCGGVLQEFRVIMRGEGENRSVVSFQREQEAIRLLETVARQNPGCAIGYTQENRQRFDTRPSAE